MWLCSRSQYPEMSRITLLCVALLCHAVSAAMTDHAAGASTGLPKESLTPSSDKLDDNKYLQTMVNQEYSSLAGTPVAGQFIVVYKAGVDAVSAAARCYASMLAYQQQQQPFSETGTSTTSYTAGHSTIAVTAVLESQASSVLGAAVIQVPVSWDAAAVRAAVYTPDVLAVVPDRFVTLASAAQGPAKQPPESSRRELKQKLDTPNLAEITTATNTTATAGTAPVSNDADLLRAVDCIGHFTDWSACGLMHAPMYQNCTKMRTFIIDTPAANGGGKCQWADGRVQYRRCPVDACAPNTPPAGHGRPPWPSPSPTRTPRHSLPPSPRPPPNPSPRLKPRLSPKPEPLQPPSRSPPPRPPQSPIPPPRPPPRPGPSPKPRQSPNPCCSPRPSPPPKPWSPVVPPPVPVMAVPGQVPGPWGLIRTSAFNPATRTVADVSDLLTGLNRTVFVAIVDTGVDASHPDLVTAGQIDYADKQGSPYYKKDGHGHGTHVAGIVGARWSAASGAGTAGVVPGMPIYAFKALNATGIGTISNVLEALTDIFNMLKQGKRIPAVILSVAMYSRGSDHAAPEELDLICGYIDGLAAYGTATVAAAGNTYGQNVKWFYPAACNSAMAVTAINEYDFPATFSNTALPTAPPWVLSSIMAAPGVNILSTYPVAGGSLEGQYSYATISGTSQAAPFVAGGFTLCVLSGQCKLGKPEREVHAVKDNFPVLLQAAKQKPCGRFSDVCAPSWFTGGEEAYYGYMLDVSAFRRP